MIELVTAPQIIAAVVAGVFAVACKVLELRAKKPENGDVQFRPRRGVIGWFAIIAAVAAVLLALMSVSFSRKSLEGQGAIQGIGRAVVDIHCVRPSTGIISVYARATSGAIEYRSSLIPRLYLNDQLIAGTWSRQTEKAFLRHEVTLTVLVALRVGENTVRIEATGDDIQPPEITGRYVVLASQ
jgi:hypothetical protein